MTSPSSQKNSPETIKEFLVFFVPTIILAIAISIAFYFYANKVRRAVFRQQEAFIVQQQEKVIHHMMHAVISDLQILVAHLHHHKKSFPPDDLLKNTTNEFYTFSRFKKVYDQIRLFDQSGMELVRVNRRTDESIIVPENQLQNKGRRYYFSDTIALDKEELFVSPMDLNVEHGAVEEPHKPMLRLGMPVFNQQNIRDGVLLINYKGHEITNNLDELSAVSAGEIMLLNNKGYWLRSDNPGNDWGFMFPEKSECTLGSTDREAWEYIQHQKNGQFFTNQGLYTFTTILPFSGEAKSINGSEQTFHPTTQFSNNDHYWWKLISFVSKRELLHYQHPYLAQYIYINIFLAFIIGCVCWRAAAQSGKKRMAEKKLRHMATRDSLTGLPNRNLLYDRLSQALARAKRNQTQFALLYLDLDRFKIINDTLGHKAGDKVLQEVSRRLTRVLRNNDTVARMGGDEFIILFTTSSRTEAEGVLKKVAAELERPIQLDAANKRIRRQIAVSGGISMYPEDGIDAESLIFKADLAMYRNKN